jgi:N-terminal domain on NACHT_NTPase and P-loop NTPases
MAEALAVVGIVASIVQLVDFGTKVLHRLNDFQSSRGEIPKAFQHVKVELPILLETLRQTESSVKNQHLGSDTEQAVLLVITRCQDEIALLNALVDKALPTEKDSWRAKTGKAILSVRRDAKVARITTNIRTHIQTLINYKVAILSTTRGIIYLSI